MMIDVEALLAPVSEDNPVGADLDGSPDRYAIEEPFQLEANAAEGEEVIIDWRDVVRRIVAQFGETKDIWLAVYLMRAGARLGDFDVVVGGAQVGQGLLGRYWSDVHPQLDQVDFIGRKAPFESLTKIRDFLNPLKQVILVDHPRLGRYTIADVQRMAQDGPGADGYGMFQAALSDLGPSEVLAVRNKVDALIDAVRETDGLLTANAMGDTSTNFVPTYEALDAIRQAVDTFAYVEPAGDADVDLGDLNLDDLGLGDAASASTDDLDFDLDALLAEVTGGEDGAQPGSPAPTPTATAPAAARGGGVVRRPGAPINSRVDAMASLQAVESYYRSNEPASPIIAILERARGWAEMDFVSLIKDLSPDSLTEIRRVLGVKDDAY